MSVDDIDPRPVKQTGMAALWEKINAWMPWVVIGLAFGWSSWVIGVRQFTKVSTDKIVIRLAHWQLEPGVRDGINDAAAEYEKLHPNVKIAQEAIPESTYGQWLTTQLLGDNAPDIVEVGMVSENVRISMYLRYILPLTRYVTQPNPYNKGTELEGVPLQETFLDGMSNSYIDETQEYMKVSLARMSRRLVYNKTLLKQLTGVDTPTANYREFLALCEKIQQTRMSNGQKYSAICNSSYHFNGWSNDMIMPLTYPEFRVIDFNRDGRFSKEEWCIGMATGKISMKDAPTVAAFEVMADIGKYSQPGWVGLSRDEAIFAFAQQKGVFIPVGLWEASGVEGLAKGRFEIGVMDFPTPDNTDPKYGAVSEGRRFENPEGNVPLAVTRSSQHPEIAVDFILFLASQKQNEKFNARLGWLPLIIGAKSAPELKPYEPNFKGVFAAFDPNLGAETTIKWQQLSAMYKVGQMSYEDLSTQFEEYFRGKGGTEDFEEFLRNLRRPGLRKEQLTSSLRAKSMLEPDPKAAANHWIKYRSIQMGALGMDFAYVQYSRALTDKEFFLKQELYKYKPEAIRRIRENLGKPAAAPPPPATPATPAPTAPPPAPAAP